MQKDRAFLHNGVVEIIDRLSCIIRSLVGSQSFKVKRNTVSSRSNREGQLQIS